MTNARALPALETCPRSSAPFISLEATKNCSSLRCQRFKGDAAFYNCTWVPRWCRAAERFASLHAAGEPLLPRCWFHLLAVTGVCKAELCAPLHSASEPYVTRWQVHSLELAGFPDVSLANFAQFFLGFQGRPSRRSGCAPEQSLAPICSQRFR